MIFSWRVRVTVSWISPVSLTVLTGFPRCTYRFPASFPRRAYRVPAAACEHRCVAELQFPRQLRSLSAVTGAGLVACGVLAGCTAAAPSSSSSAVVVQASGGPSGSYIVPAGIHEIKHVIIVMQENRSFDTYFGTYPGADGIPMKNGTPTVCVPNPAGGCTRPYHDTADVNGGGPHGEASAVADVNGGQMDGFIEQRDQGKSSCANPDDPACAAGGQPETRYR